MRETLQLARVTKIFKQLKKGRLKKLGLPISYGKKKKIALKMVVGESLSTTTCPHKGFLIDHISTLIFWKVNTNGCSDNITCNINHKIYQFNTSQTAVILTKID